MHITMASFMLVPFAQFLHCSNVHIKVLLHFLISGIVNLGQWHWSANYHMDRHLSHKIYSAESQSLQR